MTLPPELARFFAHAVPMVLADLADGDDVARARVMQDALGRSPSGDARLALARTFVRWQARHAMTSLFAPLRRAWERHEPGRFDAVVTQWIEHHRATDGDPSSIGEGFDAFLETCGPPWAAEMADLQFLRVALRRAPASSELPAHAIRFYRHVPQTTTLRPAAWVIALDRLGRLRWRSVDRAEVLALAHARGERDVDSVIAQPAVMAWLRCEHEAGALRESDAG